MKHIHGVSLGQRSAWLHDTAHNVASGCTVTDSHTHMLNLMLMMTLMMMVLMMVMNKMMVMTKMNSVIVMMTMTRLRFRLDQTDKPLPTIIFSNHIESVFEDFPQHKPVSKIEHVRGVVQA